MGALWKTNWPAARRHFVDWWNHTGLVVGGWQRCEPLHPHAAVDWPPAQSSIEQRHVDAEWRAQAERANMAHSLLYLDTLPIASTDIGPGSLGLMLGAEANFARTTVWYEPCIVDPDRHPPLRFDPGRKWWRIHEAVIKASVAAADGNYFVGCPDLIENFDTLAALRGTEPLLFDTLERPDWVVARIAEINTAFFEAYQRIYDLIRDADGGATFGAFRLWGPGKTAKVQCDAAAMLSPHMFRQFVMPALAAQCAWLDCAMFHLDGTQCVCHLDALLEIEALDAIEWTPQAGRPGGGAPVWFDMYRRILGAGKSLQVVGVTLPEVVPLLDAIGPNGVYIMCNVDSEAEAEQLQKLVAPYYPG